MIQVRSTPAGIVLSGSLPVGTVAYIDREWLTIRDAAVPALIVEGDPGSARPGEIGGDPAGVAAAAFGAVAAEAVSLLDGLPASSVEIEGEGILAWAIRDRLGAAVPRAATGLAGKIWPRTRPDPGAVIDTTGRSNVIVGSTRRLAKLGTLVLAGWMGQDGLSINLYPDLHVRGLRLVGVPLPRVGARTPGPAHRLDPPTVVALGQPLPPARWYRLDPETA